MVNTNVAKIREAKGVTKTHIAKSLGLSLQGYRYLESGETKLDVERLKIIAIILDVDVAVFFNDELTESVIKSMQLNKKAI
ncbi:helix-turn-helix domain-containing protein [Pseudobacillus badius]|uniref:helix-turn-helix domain-containing protein n=1 Tax=Bacillus badius TaxID=1455 RepID=UPI0007B06464|nr:helix-turn-helix transcriptional regulator [Bacillus badius]KZN99392.1 transcriptional regulator [Bacillus badius]OCS84979.1 transcriptional regulator [Bacillus badius]OVE49211.1 transcriptional regulator [Bacillus badius]TDW00817.1 helix-turn-helix protein [Bacillus badius]